MTVDTEGEAGDEVEVYFDARDSRGRTFESAGELVELEAYEIPEACSPDCSRAELTLDPGTLQLGTD